MRQFKNLKSFYKSDEWLDFRAQIILERGPVCQMCGRPIAASKQIHVHHLEELTEANINNPMISLNQDNVLLVCHDCHNKTHNRFGHGYVAPKQQAVYLVYGPPCSGKSSFVREHMQPGDLVVDLDALSQAISYQQMHDKPEQLKYNAFALQALLIDQIKTRYGKFANAWIIGGYPDKYKREQIARDTGAEIIFIDVPREECLARLAACEGYRRDHQEEWVQYIDRWFEKHTK